MKLPRRSIAALALAVLVGVLLLVHRSEGSDADSTAETTATAATTLTVNIVQPLHESWPVTVRADGALAAWQEAIIAAETGSLRIVALHADVGSVVRRGDLLAQLADDTAKAEVQKQEAAVGQARAALNQAQNDLKRSHEAAGSGALSEQQIDQYVSTEASDRAALASAEAALHAAQITLQQTRILAVDDGIVASRTALLGNVVAAGTELFRLLRQSRVEWQAEVDAQQLARIRVGQTAKVMLPGGQIIVGQVRLAAPSLSTDTGRAIVYVSLPAGSGAQPGMYGSGTIDLADAPALTLPESALVPRDGRSDVYVLKADGGSVARRTVVTGRRSGDRVEVLSGLDDDAQVVAAGAGFLSDGVKVKVVAAGTTASQARSAP